MADVEDLDEWRERQRREDAERAKAERTAKILSVPDRGGFPDWDHARVRSLSGIHRALVGYAERWTEGGALLVGATGAGKSTALTALAHRLAADAAALPDGWRESRAWRTVRTARYLTAAELLRSVRGHRLGAGAAAALERALEASWLVIDDLGTRLRDPSRSSPRSSMLDTVVDVRHTWGAGSRCRS